MFLSSSDLAQCRRAARRAVDLGLVCVLVSVSLPGAAGQEAAPRTAAPAKSWVPVLDSAGAWKRLPVPVKGGGQPLPAWARTLAGPLPRTTAAMLELDYLHRERSPLDTGLRAKLRWVAARAIGCAYGEAVAAADLRRAGGDAAAMEALAADVSRLPAAERAALGFARKLTANRQLIV